MTPTIKTLGIDQLPRDVQVALAQEIWDNIAAENQTIPLSQQQQIELERRLKEDDADADNVITWEEVRARAVERLRR